jgi:uncharacterized protein YjbI with pentapeptide repeats
MARGVFPPTWLRQQYSVFQQRGSAAFHQMWEVAAPVGSRGLRTIKDASRKILVGMHIIPWRIIARRYKAPLLLLGGVLLALFFLMIIIKVPQRQAASWRGQPGIELKDLPKMENDARTTIIQGLGGLALLIGLYLTLRNLQLTQDKQITEHYTRAVEQLGSDRLSVRLGAIYALERIARDSERDHWPIMEVLTAYVREHAPWPPKKVQPLADDLSPLPEKDPPQGEPAADIEAILTVLGRRTRSFEQENQQLYLYGTDLRGADLRRAHLEGADLRRSNLDGADLYGAHLEAAFLGEASLEETTLERASLERADLWGASLKKANLMQAHLEDARLHSADLEEASFLGAHLERTNLVAVALAGANLAEAFLTGANIHSADLREAHYLKIEQLTATQNLRNAYLNPRLREKIQQQYPYLLKMPSE